MLVCLEFVFPEFVIAPINGPLRGYLKIRKWENKNVKDLVKVWTKLFILFVIVSR